VSPALFIRRPVLTTLFMAAIVIFGLMAYQRLPVNDLPNVDFPTIQVTAQLPGASPETMASAVATPLERQFTTIAGIDAMTSTSARGVAQITIQFTLSRDIDAAAQDVQAAITKAAPLLPPGMPTPPTYQKVNPADQPVLYMALSSPTLPPTRWTNTPRRTWPSGSPPSPGSPRSSCSAPRSTPSACRWTPGRWPCAASASTRSSRPSPGPT
jgi:HAE1 family hydrophobic/amphiphilic exporter-1